jgi:hypothetical protein
MPGVTKPSWTQPDPLGSRRSKCGSTTARASGSCRRRIGRATSRDAITDATSGAQAVDQLIHFVRNRLHLGLGGRMGNLRPSGGSGKSAANCSAQRAATGTTPIRSDPTGSSPLPGIPAMCPAASSRISSKTSASLATNSTSASSSPVTSPLPQYTGALGAAILAGRQSRARPLL